MTDHNSMMLNAIKQMSDSHVGDQRKWDKITKKIFSDVPLSHAETEYYARLTRIYNRTGPRAVRRHYHTRLSDLDTKPRCTACGKQSQYYCYLNDQYFCEIHVVGHDPNE